MWSRLLHEDKVPLATLCISLLIVVVACGIVIFNKVSQKEPVSAAFDEDAFYYLTVARNIAGGLGPSFDGSSRTCGFQPLWVFLIAVPYFFFSNDRILFSIIYFSSFLMWLISAHLFGTLLMRFIHPSFENRQKFSLKLFFAFLFLADPHIQKYFFNGLETGLYVLALLYLLLHWPFSAGNTGVGELAPSIKKGAVLGFLILVRNDSVFFCLPFFFQLFFPIEKRRVRSALLTGAVAFALVVPWLIYVYALTGRFVPQSGMATGIGANSELLPIVGLSTLDKLSTELATISSLALPPLLPTFSFLPPYVTMGCGAIVITFLLLFVPYSRLYGHQIRRNAAAFILGAVTLVIFYCMFSRAIWFYARYFMPLKLIFLTLWALALQRLIMITSPRSRALFLVFVLVAVTGLNIYRLHHYHGYGKTLGHMGRETAALVVSPQLEELQRIGMFESGRTGYRLRSIIVNLDGKANRDALRALLENSLLDYLLDSDISGLCLKPHHVGWLDDHYPEWRRHYDYVGHAATAEIFRRL